MAALRSFRVLFSFLFWDNKQQIHGWIWQQVVTAGQTELCCSNTHLQCCYVLFANELRVFPRGSVSSQSTNFKLLGSKTLNCDISSDFVEEDHKCGLNGSGSVCVVKC